MQERDVPSAICIKNCSGTFISFRQIIIEGTSISPPPIPNKPERVPATIPMTIQINIIVIT
jgi:hypothetical protein